MFITGYRSVTSTIIFNLHPILIGLHRSNISEDSPLCQGFVGFLLKTDNYIGKVVS